MGNDSFEQISSQQLRRLLRDSLAIFKETQKNYEQVVMDPSDWKAMRLIAQRMNGFQGSFGFLPDDLEYKFNIRELAELAELITDYYSKKKLPIGENELAILNDSLDALEKVMLLLKERKPLDDDFINDVSAMSFDDKSIEVLAKGNAQVCLMHGGLNPEKMQLEAQK